MASHRAGERSDRILLDVYYCSVAVVNEIREVLRDAGVNPQRLDGGNGDDRCGGLARVTQQLGFRRRGGCCDECALIGIARSYDAVEGRPYYIVRLHRLQLA